MRLFGLHPHQKRIAPDARGVSVELWLKLQTDQIFAEAKALRKQQQGREDQQSQVISIETKRRPTTKKVQATRDVAWRVS